MRHARDSQENRRRLYTDGSGINERIAAAPVTPSSQTSLFLGGREDAQVYHAELSGILQALEAEEAVQGCQPIP
jgi:hypothetical protein